MSALKNATLWMTGEVHVHMRDYLIDMILVCKGGCFCTVLEK